MLTLSVRVASAKYTTWEATLFCLMLCFFKLVPSLEQLCTGSPSRGGDIVVYIFDINKPSSTILFLFFFFSFVVVLVPVSVIMALSSAFHSINTSFHSRLSHSALPALFLCLMGFQLHISL